MIRSMVSNSSTARSRSGPTGHLSIRSKAARSVACSPDFTGFLQSVPAPPNDAEAEPLLLSSFGRGPDRERAGPAPAHAAACHAPDAPRAALARKALEGEFGAVRRG